MYNVLITDDEEIERESVRMILENSHLDIARIFEAENGRKGLDILDKERIDLVLLDISMPGISGLQMLEMLRAKGSEVKVIISTAYSEFNNAVKALQFGALDFLVKPVEDEVLVQSVEKAIERLEKERREEEKISRIEDYLRLGAHRIVEEEDSSMPDAVKRIKTYIESNYDKRIGLEEIATDCGFSKFYINKVFKSAMDTTVMDYLVRFRMEKAKELLELTRESVKNIAFRTGYSDPNYFTWTFKKAEGMTPLQYRASRIKTR